MKFGDVELIWKGNASFLIKARGKIIYIDPYQLHSVSEEEKADIILITHGHQDHCSIEDLGKVAKSGTLVLTPADCQSKMTKLDELQMRVVEPGDEIDLGKIRVKAVHAYNINKQFHDKSENWMGYIVEIGNLVIYHAGDTDLIPEMEKLTGYSKQGNEFIALLPIGGIYTMDVEEAVEAASKIKPSLVIPMHYGSLAGSEEDARKFCELAKERGLKCMILEKE